MQLAVIALALLAAYVVVQSLGMLLLILRQGFWSTSKISGALRTIGAWRGRGAVGCIVAHRPTFPAATSTRHVSIGRISMPQPRCSFRRAAGCFDATWMASFRSRASIRK